ncbi:MAG: metallopeptidase TldD-related protein [Pseudomonadota bacterium]
MPIGQRRSPCFRYRETSIADQRYGFIIENGELSQPFRGATIAGSLLDMFLPAAPANDLEFRGAMNAPTLRIEGLTTAG